MNTLYNELPLGFNKKNSKMFYTMDYKCNVIVSDNCSEYLSVLLNNVTNNYKKSIYVEIQGDDEQLNIIVSELNLKLFNLIPMSSNGLFKYKLGVLQFFTNDCTTLNYVASLWNSELFIRLSLLKNNIQTFDWCFAKNLVVMINNSDVIITQSGDAEEIEIVFKDSIDFDSLLKT